MNYPICLGPIDQLVKDERRKTLIDNTLFFITFIVMLAASVIMCYASTMVKIENELLKRRIVHLETSNQNMMSVCYPGVQDESNK